MEFPATFQRRCSDELNCTMDTKEKGEFDVVVAVRLIMACLSIFGAFSIVSSAIYRKTICNPKVHPIFVVSIVDTLLSLLWIGGSIVWLEGGARKQNHSRVRCFTINLMTIILQCVAMNVTLIYALLAYCSMKQKANDSFYVVQQRPVYIHVWHPLVSFFAYFVAWTLPVVLVMIPFGVISRKYSLVQDANKLSCWCLPFYGNVLPRPQIGYHNGEEANRYLEHLHSFITSYSVVLISNFTVVFCCMVVIYFKVFRLIRYMLLMQGSAENTPLLGATRAVILDGHKRATNRIFLFLCIYFVTGIITVGFGIENVVTAALFHINPDFSTIAASKRRIYTLLLLEAIFVPVQGFLNALAYGWTREGFLTAMSSRRSIPPSQADWPAVSQESRGDDQLQRQNSVLASPEDEGELEETVAEVV